MTTAAHANPYLTDAAPFAKRKAIYERLYQALTNPVQTPPLLVMGGRQSGKSALLRHFNDWFDPAQFIGVYLPLRDTPLPNERLWLSTLASQTVSALVAHGYMLARLPDMLPPQSNPQQWFTKEYFPRLSAVVTQRIVYLLDDVDVLWAAIDGGRLPEDTLDFLRGLCQNPHFGCLLTLDSRYEPTLPRLAPLVAATDALRLAHLSAEDVGVVVNNLKEYTLAPGAANAVYTATGGHPLWVQRYGYHLFQQWLTAPEQTSFTSDDLREVQPFVYSHCEPDFRLLWAETPPLERMVLMAIAHRHYDDPLAGVTPTQIQAWLAETDFPADMTAINAAVRGLEYHEQVSHAPEGGLRISADLLQMWLLDNGQPETPSSAVSGANAPRRNGVALALVVALLVVLLWLVVNRPAPRPTPTPAGLATVTLIAPTVTP